VEAQLIELNLTVAHLILTITDTSEGLKPEVIINLFNSFTQTDFSPSKRFGATGLDLAIAKKLSHLMNGDITIQNKPNQGSTFTFHMKLETQKHPPELAQKTTSTDLTNLKVLVAEDDLSNQTLIKAMLESFHIIPTLVENGLEAVNMAKTKEFDLILMDCQMPILNGYQATQKIRESPNTQNIPIIALTADVMPEDKTRALDVGCNAHLSKPIDIIKLQTCLKEHAP
jgi:CheY-like chemotaxis protein